ncbi:putative transporter [Beauveria bassiana]|nr:putative transporter [Beauveria bassiana]
MYLSIDAKGLRKHASPAETERRRNSSGSPGSLDWATIAMNVSRGFHEKFPRVNLDNEQFQIIAQLSMEAIYKNQNELVTEKGGHGGEPSASSQQTSLPIIDSETQNVEPPAAKVIENLISASHARFLEAISDVIPPIRDQPHDVSNHLLSQELKAGPRSSTDSCLKNYNQIGSLASEKTAMVLHKAIDHLPSFEDAKVLIDTFFTFVESNWYYLDEEWFRDLFTDVYQGNIAAPQPRQCTIVCLVFLVLALGSSFKHLSETDKLLAINGEIPGSLFFAQAMELIQKVIAANTIESTICCLLTSFYLLATEDISHHHVYLGLALNLAVGQSLHCEGTRNDETPREREMKVRLFWTIYSIERQTSRIMGLPMLLRLDDVAAALPQKRWDLDKDDLHRIDRFVAYIQLTILLDEFTVAGPIEQSSTTYKWACSKQESSRLLIPAYLDGVQESLFRPHAHLNILYNLNWVAIGRGALLRLVRRQIRPSTADTISLGDDGTHLRSQELAHRCTEAASTITDWIVQLQSRNLLAKFSFMDLHACSSAVIILLLNILLHPDNHQLLAISHGIDALRFMAGGSMLATKALRLAERLQQGVYQATGLAYEEIIPSRPPLFTPTIDQHFPHESTLGAERNALSTAALDDGMDNHVAPSATPLDLDIFTDLETFFLDCSEQNRHLFGFDGFESAFASEGV